MEAVAASKRAVEQWRDRVRRLSAFRPFASAPELEPHPSPAGVPRSSTTSELDVPASLPALRTRSGPPLPQHQPTPLAVAERDVCPPCYRDASVAADDVLDQEGSVHSVIGISVVTIHHSTLVQGTPLAALVAAMARWKDDFKREHDDGGLDPFWHRKSKKMVLAVVALDTGDGLTFVRACNLEVSMPSGSLCAERNAIGTALSMYPRCSRADFKGVATLSLTEGEGNLNPLPPCGVCSEWLEKIVEVQPNFRVVTFSCQDLTYVNLSSLAPLSAALKQIANASRQAPALAPPAGAAPPAGPDEEDINVPLSSASHVVINPQRPTDLNALKLKRTSFSGGGGSSGSSLNVGGGAAPESDARRASPAPAISPVVGALLSPAFGADHVPSAAG